MGPSIFLVEQACPRVLLSPKWCCLAPIPLTLTKLDLSVSSTPMAANYGPICLQTKILAATQASVQDLMGLCM